MKKLIVNGQILTPKSKLDNYAILIEDDLILAVAKANEFPSDLPQIDAGGKWVVPGLIDIHTHGGAGWEVMDPQPEALPTMARFFATKGVTSFLATTTSSSGELITAAIERVSAVTQPQDGARILGVHLEGPYLGQTRKGAQSPKHLRPAKPEEYLPWLESGVVKMMTVAPEVDGAMDLIEAGVKYGVKFAAGHTSASYEEMLQAIDRGLTLATHTFNGMEPLHHRQPGVVGAVLTESRVYAQVIADGVHLHPAVVKLIVDAKGPDRTILITDSIRAAGVGDGKFKKGDQYIVVKDGIARVESGSLAGSTLTLDRGLRNAYRFSRRRLEEILCSATSVAAECIGLADQIGSIKPGYKADLVFLDHDLEPCLTMVSGKVVFAK